MKKMNLAAGVCLALVSLGAQAHAHLQTSNPKDGAAVAQAPGAISLTFSESARITAVAIQKGSEPKQPLTAPATIGEQIDVKIPALSPGTYTLSWRVTSTDDNHIMSGQLHFTVAP